MTWTNFRAQFLEKYFPNDARYEREAKSLTLQQGTMTVQAYTKKFSSTWRGSTRRLSQKNGVVENLRAV